ncbi:protein translocase subunit SecD [Helicobacter monodelphidis]|uniref:protein translocase subunit SecD n=1 Tax=Helicobacter sp. 15-1451 TaxID=2004995 RepID=UPI00215B9EFA|nr:protein translocase subunit SecD [Helicobacter sp. 15-1451]
MKGLLNQRFIAFFLASLFGIILTLPSLIPSLPGPKITLGLDLQGGLSMLLGIKTEEAVASKMRTLGASIHFFSNQEEILIKNLKSEDDIISFSILDTDDQAKMDAFIKQNGEFVVQYADGQYTITMSEQEILKTQNYALEQALVTIRDRLDQFGLGEPSVTRQGDSYILAEIAGVHTKEEEERVKDLIARAAVLQMMAVDEDYNARVNTMSTQEAENLGDVILPFVDSAPIQAKKTTLRQLQNELKTLQNQQSSDLHSIKALEERISKLEQDLQKEDAPRVLLLKSIPILDGSMLTNANVVYDQYNRPAINFSLNAEGAKRFGDFTANNINKRMAIVLDGRVYSAPSIRERISGSGQITGEFSESEASDIAIALRSGALLAPIELLEQQSVGPSLGSDSIAAAMVALVSGFILTVLFMLFYYGIAGLIANIALFVNLFLIIAIMAMFEATLTLPGMAGIVLTIGMAVDANVIINERIRECFREGKSILVAIESGYENAQRAIFDSNLTALITSVLLYIFGTGAIKGFAITISIGILASILTAIVGTHGIYQWLYPRISANRLNLWFGYKGH